jgi:hypothetical protein
MELDAGATSTTTELQSEAVRRAQIADEVLFSKPSIADGAIIANTMSWPVVSKPGQSANDDIGEMWLQEPYLRNYSVNGVMGPIDLLCAGTKVEPRSLANIADSQANVGRFEVRVGAPLFESQADWEELLEGLDQILDVRDKITHFNSNILEICFRRGVFIL